MTLVLKRLAYGFSFLFLISCANQGLKSSFPNQDAKDSKVSLANEPKAEPKVDAKIDSKADVKAEIKTDAKSDNKSENSSSSAETIASVPSVETLTQGPPTPTLESFHLADDQTTGSAIVDFDSIPSEVNPMVEKWIEYFQGKGSKHMERYLARSTRYEKLMKKVLSDNKLPEDLFYIALIESGFSSSAFSHASAVGYWQFIRGTGKRYGLEINRFVDERRDPEIATQAAADYFKELYSLFGSWYLAMASYNVGEGRVKREVNRHDTRDFWEIAKKRKLPKETINYIPKYLAARLIAKNPAKYGFEGIDYLLPIEFDTIKVEHPVNLRMMSEKMNINYEDFKALNPKFKGEVAPLSNGKAILRVPVGSVETALVAAGDSKVDKVEFIADTGDIQEYKIRRGESLYTIARKYRTTVAYLRDLNDIPRKKRLKVGSKIYVPDRTPRLTPVEKQQTTRIGEQIIQEGISKFYIVQSGDSLFSIAMKYNTTVEQLKKLNQIKRGRLLKVGAKIKLPEGVSTDDGKSDEQKSQNSQNSTLKKFNRSNRMLASARIKLNHSLKKNKKHIAKYHVVKRGENLTLIAKKYDVDVLGLKKDNRLKPNSKLLVGQRIAISPEN